jgi:hypothetical protein
MARNAQIMRHKPGNPNISRYRPAKSARYNGKLQKAAVRCFIALDSPISTAEAAEWLYPLANRPHYRNVKRVLLSLGCVKLKRIGGMGRPLLWAPPLI